MELLLFRQSTWKEEYNCDSYTANYQTEEYDHFYLSILYIFLGSVFLIMYIPCIYAMTKGNMLTESCYKIMLCLAVYDVLGLVVSGIVSGVFGLLHFGFCSSPITLYVLGSVGDLAWFGQVSTALLLALNRCFFLRNVHLSNVLFGGNRTWIWMLFGPFAWSFIGFMTSRPAILSLSCMVWFMNPHDGYIKDAANLYNLPPYHYSNNIIGATALPGVYIMFLVLYYLKTNHWAFKGASYLQQSVFFQSLLISLFTAVLASSYLAIQYIHIPKEWYYFTQLMWIVFSGLASVVYLVMNRSIRRRIWKVIRHRALSPQFIECTFKLPRRYQFL
uniref:7TM GPCR serpentine receptor class x (Srx) domain-containing protein n=1 Tax=Panagrellus redivivus TaxID=6233 RepID=A0A7E4W8H6_PANRE